MNAVPLAACLLALAALPSVAQSSNTYSESTDGRDVVILIQRDPLPDGFLVRSYMSNGDYYEVEYGASDATVRYRVRIDARGVDYTATRRGNVIFFEGTFGGRKLSRAQRIDDHPWFETVEMSLSGFALAGDGPPLVFWIVQPWEAKAYLMQALNEGEDTVEPGGRPVSAWRVCVRPYGLLALAWRSLYWFRATDGLFTRYEAVRGLPGTPLTVVELTSED